MRAYETGLVNKHSAVPISGSLHDAKHSDGGNSVYSACIFFVGRQQRDGNGRTPGSQDWWRHWSGSTDNDDISTWSGQHCCQRSTNLRKFRSAVMPQFCARLHSAFARFHAAELCGFVVSLSVRATSGTCESLARHLELTGRYAYANLIYTLSHKKKYRPFLCLQ